MFLTPEELYDLTHRRRPKAQLSWLHANQIEARLRADGTVVALRAAVEAKFGAPARKPVEPNWGAIDATQKTA